MNAPGETRRNLAEGRLNALAGLGEFLGDRFGVLTLEVAFADGQ